jgi:hypothetical protein
MVAAWPAASPLLAQENPAVRTAVALAAEGLTDSARALIERIVRRERPGEASFVEALFWRARLAAIGDSAERDLRRVALEFPGSQWADDALLELSQLALTAGNPASSLELALRLRSDYPGSPLRPRSALWAARAAFEVGEPRTACALLDSALGESAADVEFGNQVMFYRGRCAAAALSTQPSRPPEAQPAAESAAAPVPATAAAPAWMVQVFASRARGDADAVVRRLEAAGLGARVSASDDGYHRVRLGPFAGEAEAREAAAAARRVVGGSPFLVRAP